MAKRDILIIEDNESDAMLMREAIKETLMENNVMLVNDATEAVKLLNKKEKYAKAPRPDLILMDLRMPNFNGFEFLQIVKKDPRFASIPVIVMTGSDEETDIAQAYKLMANCYIVKPVNFVKYKRVVSVINDFWLGVAKLPPKPIDKDKDKK